MKNNDCLSEQDLILHYYGELPVNGEQSRHLLVCQLCTERFSRLASTLSKLPALEYEFDPSAGTRLAARVSEQLHRRRTFWSPALGFSAAAAIVIIVSFTLWPQPAELPQTTLHTPTTTPTLNFDEEMPDIDFLEDLELLQELEFLSQIEGV